MSLGVKSYSQIELNPSCVAKELLPELIDLFTKHLNEIKKLPVYLTREETAEMLKISIPTLDKYTKAGILSKYIVGNTTRYKLNEIDAALKKLSFSK